MKKIYLSIFIVISIFLTACSSNITESKPLNLEQAYFLSIDKIESQSDLSKDFLDEFMSEYDFSDYFEPDGRSMRYYNNPQNIDEIFTVAYNSGGKLEYVRYSNKLKDCDIIFNCIVENSSKKLTATVKNDVTFTDVDLMSLLDKNSSELLSLYNNLATSKDLIDFSIDDISDFLSMSPTHQKPSSSTSNYRYIFEKGNESIIVNCEEENGEVYAINYVEINSSGENIKSKETNISATSPSGNTPAISTYIVDSTEVKQSILNILK